MAKSAIDPTLSTRKQRRFDMRPPNQPLMKDGYWHATIKTIPPLIASIDGVKQPQMEFHIVGPGDQNSAILMKVRFPFEFGYRTDKNGEREYTELTRFFMQLGLVHEEHFDPEHYDTTMAEFDPDAAIGLAIKGIPERGSVNGGVSFDVLPWHTISAEI